jgi:hypothetical protein
LTQQLAQLRYRLDEPAPSVQVALPAQAARPLRVVAVDDLLQLDDGASLEHMLGRRCCCRVNCRGRLGCLTRWRWRICMGCMGST